MITPELMRDTIYVNLLARVSTQTFTNTGMFVCIIHNEHKSFLITFNCRKKAVCCVQLNLQNTHNPKAVMRHYDLNTNIYELEHK